jgi:hypothetical protein
MVLTAYSELSPATNSSCHRRRRIKVHRDPVGLVNLRRLDTSNGCQDHTVLPYAATLTDPRLAMCCQPHFSKGVEAPFVHAPVDCSRALPQWKARPAIPLRDDAAASTASHPNVRDDRDTSLSRDGMARNKEMIWVRKKREYFCEGGRTGKSVKPRPSAGCDG